MRRMSWAEFDEMMEQGSTKRREQSQQDRIVAIWAEFDEAMLHLGPRLFDDEFYDNTKEVKVSQKKRKRGHAPHQSNKP